MLTLKDSVTIKATREEIEEWMRNIDKHYREWHPDHVRWVNLDGGLDEGDRFYYEEYLHGRLYKSSCRITRVKRNGKAVIEFKGLSIPDRLMGVRGSFIIEPAEDGCVVTATISLRFGRLISTFFGSIVGDIERHMMEEGENLKRLLER